MGFCHLAASLLKEHDRGCSSLKKNLERLKSLDAAKSLLRQLFMQLSGVDRVGNVSDSGWLCVQLGEQT